MYSFVFFCIIIYIAVTSHVVECGIQTSAERLKCTTDEGCIESNLKTLNFLLLGDTGGLPVYPYVTYAQNKVAKAISKVGEEMKIKFLITVGDNFYFTGVENVFDDRFDSTFADVYNGDILQKPWYMIGGNHDHFGNITAQTAYTNQSSRWTYPSLYYKVSYKFSAKNTSVDFLMIDTIVLCGNTRDIDNAGFFDMIFADVSKNPNNPRDPEAARKQWQWIEEQLSQSKADYLFVAGHYPIYSVSEHGPTQCLVDKLNPLLRKYKASAYFSGHDHYLQHLMIKETYDSDGEEQLLKDESEPSVMHYIISGAGSRSDRSMKHKNNVPVGSHLFSYPTRFNPFSQLGFTNGGFVGVEVTDQSANFKFFSGESQQKYNCSIRRRIF